MSKIYECCICHKVLTEYKPIRLVKQIYGRGNYNQYGYMAKYDFCKDCYKTFVVWIAKHRKEEVKK